MPGWSYMNPRAVTLAAGDHSILTDAHRVARPLPPHGTPRPDGRRQPTRHERPGPPRSRPPGGGPLVQRPLGLPRITPGLPAPSLGARARPDRRRAGSRRRGVTAALPRPAAVRAGRLPLRQEPTWPIWSVVSIRTQLVRSQFLPTGLITFRWAVLTYRRGNQFGGGTITVTAYAEAGNSSDPNMHMEVVQLGTQVERTIHGPLWFLNIVVRNNSHAGDPEATIIGHFLVWPVR
jgi:hypothetical protein